MKPYHKIDSVFKRNERGRILMGEWVTPEIDVLKDLTWNWTEKLDGTNIRIWTNADGELTIGGRTDRAEIPKPLLLAIGEQLEGKTVPEGLTLYGEGIGPKIQNGGRYGATRVVLFDVRGGDWWLKQEDARDVASSMGLPFATEVGSGTLSEAIERVAAGLSSSHGDVEAEGLICRPPVQLFNRMGRRVLCKVKIKDLR